MARTIDRRRVRRRTECCVAYRELWSFSCPLPVDSFVVLSGPRLVARGARRGMLGFALFIAQHLVRRCDLARRGIAPRLPIEFFHGTVEVLNLDGVAVDGDHLEDLASGALVPGLYQRALWFHGCRPSIELRGMSCSGTPASIVGLSHRCRCTVAVAISTALNWLVSKHSVFARVCTRALSVVLRCSYTRDERR